MMTMSDTVAALGAKYNTRKQYSLRSVKVQQLVHAHGLVENRWKGGYMPLTASRGYRWSVYEAENKAVMVMADGQSMISPIEWDTVILLGKNKQDLEELQHTGAEIGMVDYLMDTAYRRRRLAIQLLQKDKNIACLNSVILEAENKRLRSLLERQRKKA